MCDCIREWKIIFNVTKLQMYTDVDICQNALDPVPLFEIEKENVYNKIN